MASVCIFCGSAPGNSPRFVDTARLLAQQLAHAGHAIVYGGGGDGIMGAIADGCLDAGGQITGVIPTALVERELMHPQVRDMRVVENMHARKALMHELSDVFLALPGGFGTLEELFEVVCWRQLNFHSANVAVLNIEGYYDSLIEFANNVLIGGFISSDTRRILTELSEPQDVLDWLSNARNKEEG